MYYRHFHYIVTYLPLIIVLSACSWHCIICTVHFCITHMSLTLFYMYLPCLCYRHVLDIVSYVLSMYVLSTCPWHCILCTVHVCIIGMSLTLSHMYCPCLYYWHVLDSVSYALSMLVLSTCPWHCIICTFHVCNPDPTLYHMYCQFMYYRHVLDSVRYIRSMLVLTTWPWQCIICTFYVCIIHMSLTLYHMHCTCDLFVFICVYSDCIVILFYSVADSRGGASTPPSNKSSTYINIRFSKLVSHDMAFNRMVSICVMKVKENTN